MFRSHKNLISVITALSVVFSLVPLQTGTVFANETEQAVELINDETLIESVIVDDADFDLSEDVVCEDAAYLNADCEEVLAEDLVEASEIDTNTEIVGAATRYNFKLFGTDESISQNSTEGSYWADNTNPNYTGIMTAAAKEYVNISVRPKSNYLYWRTEIYDTSLHRINDIKVTKVTTSDNLYTFEMPAQDIIIKVVFKPYVDPVYEEEGDDPAVLPEEQITLTADLKTDPKLKSFKLTDKTFHYTGKRIKFPIQIYDGVDKNGEPKLLAKGNDYHVYYTRNLNAGKAKLRIVGCGSYKDKIRFSTSFRILPVSISDNKLFQVFEPTYNDSKKGYKVNPLLVWKYVNDKGEYKYKRVLKRTRDYKVSHEGDTKKAFQSGMGKIKGRKNFTGTITFQYTITPIENRTSIESTIINLKDSYSISDNVCPIPDITDKKTGARLVKGKDYDVEYVNNTSIGTAWIIIGGMDKYYGCTAKKFKIVGTNAKKFKTPSLKNQKHTGNSIKPVPLVYYPSVDNNNLLKEGTDYVLYYSYNRKVGWGRIKIQGKGLYTGSKTIKFQIKE